MNISWSNEALTCVLIFLVLYCSANSARTMKKKTPVEMTINNQNKRPYVFPA